MTRLYPNKTTLRENETVSDGEIFKQAKKENGTFCITIDRGAENDNDTSTKINTSAAFSLCKLEIDESYEWPRKTAHPTLIGVRRLPKKIAQNTLTRTMERYQLSQWHKN